MCRKRPPNFELKLPRPDAGPAAELPCLSQVLRRHAARRCVKVKGGERRADPISARGPWPRSLARDPLGGRVTSSVSARFHEAPRTWALIVLGAWPPRPPRDRAGPPLGRKRRYSETTEMDSDIWQILLGAALAVIGGMLGELWRELRANQAEVRALRGEIDGLIATCDIYLRQGSEISISNYLTYLQSFAVQGAGNRTWLRAVTDREDREHVFILYAMASSLAHNVERLVARERDAPDRDAFHAAIKENRQLVVEGFESVRRQAEQVAGRLASLQERPLLA
jgi:hypothetical protein